MQQGIAIFGEEQQIRGLTLSAASANRTESTGHSLAMALVFDCSRFRFGQKRLEKGNYRYRGSIAFLARGPPGQSPSALHMTSTAGKKSKKRGKKLRAPSPKQHVHKAEQSRTEPNTADWEPGPKKKHRLHRTPKCRARNRVLAEALT